MPTIELNRAVVEKLMGKKLPTDKLKDRISMIGTDLDDVTKDTIHVEIFPNRPDMLAEGGFARALSSFIGVNPGIQQYTTKQSKYAVNVEKSVQAVRPYTACAVVTGLKFTDERIKEMIQLQEKLHTTFCRNRKKAAIGIYPMEKITWPIRYLAADPKKMKFIPLESDKEMDGMQILSKHPAGREYAHLLEGKNMFPYFIDSADEVLSMPPIINSHLTGKIDEKTTEVFIETSGFDLKAQSTLLNIIVTDFAEMGGTIHLVTVNYPAGYDTRKLVSPDLKVREIPLKLDYMNRLLGLTLKEAELKKLLERMGLSLKQGKVLIPAYRADILHPIDIVEDVAIAYGYENFKPELPNVSTVGEASPMTLFEEKVARLMAGLGLLETHTYHISSKEVQCDKMGVAKRLVEIEKTSSAEFSIPRAWMLPSLISVLEGNRRHEYPQRFYELGTIFVPEKGTDTGVRESLSLCTVVAHQKANITEVRQLLDSLMRHLGLAAEVTAAEHESFIPGRAGTVKVLGKEIGIIGEIRPQVLEAFGMEQPTSAFEICLTRLLNIIENQSKG